MCGRFNLTATPEQVIETFKLQSLFDFQTSYNITPGQNCCHCVIRWVYWGQ